MPDLDSRPDPEPVPGRLTMADLRADYDDDFGHLWTPREVARRRVFVPAIAYIGTGSLFALTLVVVAGGVLIVHLEDALDDEFAFLGVAVGTVLLLAAAGFFGLVVAGGASMLRLRNRWLALFAAYVVTVLSIAGLYGILFYPFGIWGLILLYRPDVRKEFDTPPPEPSPTGEPPTPPALPVEQPARPPGRTEWVKERLLLPGIGLIILGSLGVLGCLFAAVAVVVAAWDDSRHWTEDEVFGYLTLCLGGVAAFTLVILGGAGMIRLRRYNLARAAGYIAASVPLIGTPLGVWALVRLHQREVRQEFGRPPEAASN